MLCLVTWQRYVFTSDIVSTAPCSSPFLLMMCLAMVRIVEYTTAPRLDSVLGQGLSVLSPRPSACFRSGSRQSSHRSSRAGSARRSRSGSQSHHRSRSHRYSRSPSTARSTPRGPSSRRGLCYTFGHPGARPVSPGPDSTWSQVGTGPSSSSGGYSGPTCC